MRRLATTLVLIAFATAAGCGRAPEREPSAEQAPMTVPDRAPLADAAELASVLRAQGIDVPSLDVFHADDGGTTYAFDVAAADAVATWTRVRGLVGQTGRYPVVVRDEDGMLAEQTEINDVLPHATLAAAAEIDAAAWFDERAASDPEYYGGVEEGSWEDVEPQSGFTVPFDVLSGEPAPEVRILLVPTPRPWEVPAYLRLGGWNECPLPEEHVAVQRSWFERYGAEVVCVSGAVVELRVTRSPGGNEALLALAREHFLYSGGDLVYQGYGSLRALAASLRGAETWYFWWD